MKTLITDYLQHRFPANGNFMSFISEEIHSNLIMLCESLYPDSEQRAYIISGCERTTSSNRINISRGVVFYKKGVKKKFEVLFFF
jgi:hypothetical protein